LHDDQPSWLASMDTALVSREHNSNTNNWWIDVMWCDAISDIRDGLCCRYSLVCGTQSWEHNYGYLEHIFRWVLSISFYCVSYEYVTSNRETVVWEGIV
jgi:hypothetical protein